jgi:cardiolipin synthase
MKHNKNSKILKSKNVSKNKAKNSINNSISEKNILNINDVLKFPNFITSLRIILAPVFIYLLFNDLYVKAFIVAIIAAFSDLFDGLAARTFNMTSKFGAILDPIADVTFTTTVLIGLMIKIHFPLWLGAIILSRELLILFGGLFAIRKGKTDLAKADIFGKLSRFSQVTTLILFLLVYITPEIIPALDLLTYTFIYTCTILTLISFVNYTRRIKSLL